MTERKYSRIPLGVKIKHVMKNKKFYIELWLGMRKFHNEWARCHQHENCWVKWYNIHYRDIKHQIYSGGWWSSSEPKRKGGHCHTGFECECGLTESN